MCSSSSESESEPVVSDSLQSEVFDPDAPADGHNKDLHALVNSHANHASEGMSSGAHQHNARTAFIGTQFDGRQDDWYV